MLRKIVLLTLVMLPACKVELSEDSATCGFMAMAGATKVLQFLENNHAVLVNPPPGLAGRVPARVIGHGTGSAIVGKTDLGVVLGFEGEGLPSIPGFGLVVVDDSSEAVRGVLIYEIEPPQGAPQIGTIEGPVSSLPLYAARIKWSFVSDPKCPLIRPADSATSAG